MKKPPRIHQGKQPVRRHYIAEWLEARHMDPMDLLNALNEPGTHNPIDKSQVYRWVRGNLPRADAQLRIAAVLELTDPETGEPDPTRLLHHPDQDWIARKLQDRTPDEIRRIKRVLDAAFPDKTGTDG